LLEITTMVGGPRDAAQAIDYAQDMMTSPGVKIIVLFVNGKLEDDAAAIAAAAALPDSFKVYTAVNKDVYMELKPVMGKIASEYGFLPSKGMHIAESFQLDLNVIYRNDPNW